MAKESIDPENYHLDGMVIWNWDRVAPLIKGFELGIVHRLTGVRGKAALSS
jgi:hypothetical protein